MNAPVNLIPLHEDKQPFYVPAFELYLKARVKVKDEATGKEKDEEVALAVRDVIEVRYEDGIEKIDAFTLTVNNWDAERRKPLYYGHEANPGIFYPGNELWLYMGYQGELRLMMSGFITGIDVQFPESGSSRIVVSGLNILERLRRQQYTWSWPDDGKAGIRDSDVAKLLERKPDDKEGRPGLGVKVVIDDAAAAKEPYLPNIYMNNQFPIVFLMERARRCGYEVLAGEQVVTDKKTKEARKEPFIYFGPTASLREVTYELEWGMSLVSFHPSFAGANQIYAVKVCGWDRTAKKRIEERRTLDDLLKKPKAKVPNADHISVARAANREEIITDPPARTIQEARDRADNVLISNIGRMVEAIGTTVGLPDLRSGRSVKIGRTGEQFDGLYTVLSSTHLLDASGYRTSFTARRVEPPEEFRRPQK